MAESANKRQKTGDEDTYHLLYWPGIPGRGEHIRVLLEEAGVSYTDTAHTPSGIHEVTNQISSSNTGSDLNPPPLCPPILRHNSLIISQTPNILQYLGHQLSLLPANDPTALYQVNSLALTALDGLCSEPHETHHPISVSSYYEEQRSEAKLRAHDYRVNRLPKFLGYFQRVLSSPCSKGGEYLYAGQLTYADLVLFQCVDGLRFAFPKCLKKMENSNTYDKVFALYGRVKQRKNIKAYLESDRRQEYSMGIYRHYPELDDDDDEGDDDDK